MNTFSLLIILAHGLTLAIGCPPSETYSPCDCGNYTDDGRIYLDCNNQNLGDSKISDILNAFLPDNVRDEFDHQQISQLGDLQLKSNQLNRVPVEIRLFKRLDTVNLSFNNIKTVKSGDFNFTVPLKQLILSSNSISTIHPGAFNGNYGKDSKINLSKNDLTRFDSGVFQSFLEKISPFGPYNAYVNIRKNFVDCVSDPCHMAWLIRDHRHLITTAIFDGTTNCSNGTAFDQLNIDEYKNCPITPTFINSPVISSRAGYIHSSSYVLIFISLLF